MSTRPDVVILMTDQERAAPPYEPPEVSAWRKNLVGAAWFTEHGVSFGRHYTGSLACVPSRPTLFTGQYPDVHGVTQTNGLGKMADDSRMRWLRPGEVPTLGHWFRAGGYDTHYQGKWHMSHADLVGAAGVPLATNDDEGAVDTDAEQAYLDADPLDEFGFSGWIGPEPHGVGLANSGLVRDRLFADRVVAWLEDRYARRRAGDAAALRPFLLVASFVNPHDIVYAPAWLGPAWLRRGEISLTAAEPPPIPASPTDDEDLSTKPAAQIAYRASYPTTYGLAPAVERVYRNHAAEYRSLYYRLHAEVDGPLDRVRRAVTEGGSPEAVLVRTSDHGELLGAHGGLHQKWFNLYDEATRVPFVVARVGSKATAGRVVDDAPTSHVDLVPTLLGAAGIDAASAAEELRGSHTEVHPLPGRDLMDVVDGNAEPDGDRSVYLMTRDNMPEGDSGASGMARRIGRTPPPLRIQVPAHVGANFESLVCRIGDARPAADAGDGDDGRVDSDGTESSGAGHLWKIVRTFDDPATWTEPGVRHLAADGPAGEVYRTESLPDQWELYDLDADPIEAHNRWADPSAQVVFAELTRRLADERARAVPERNTPWPYATRLPSLIPALSSAAASGSASTEVRTGPDGRSASPPSAARGTSSKKVPPPVRALRKVLQRLGMHPDDTEAVDVDLSGRRALIVATNHGVLDIGKPTGVFASEMTVPYYAFVDAGMSVDVASPKGGVIPVEPQSLRAPLRTEACDRFLADDVFKGKVQESLAVGDVGHYDIIFLAGGWGAAFDLGFSEDLGRKITEANRRGSVIGGVCHGPLGLLKAKAADGSPLVAGRRVTGVTDKQVRELRITATPQHPETELRKAGALFESVTRFRDPFANHWVVDGNLVTGQNQNAAPMVAREMLRLLSHD
ncbi:MAG: sulfatase-like hydrolase/transferase [Acidimicrobiales bacterium]|nr:sulfatase-like hydrolase/transferase [Acidimicrobiales bacterium]MXX41613.1 sulfatase-like hydrolase/transferase [Acidimicrobiales bacterium]MYB80320.1 sulfatase-like hydrolase/transferase [Acidimicrobiales bacterium]MYI09495.1 sulfatase-like hydrolase/transferase [Acidimicrobiales bacterium]MYI11954.1 sulfatase-like hydrolase/transferase [Acidimicrobiales bacterium]